MEAVKISKQFLLRALADPRKIIKIVHGCFGVNLILVRAGKINNYNHQIALQDIKLMY